MQSKSPQRSGFTLVEVLIVVAIIAALTAILVPVFSTVRARARCSTCQSNLRQIGLAAALYLQDCDGQHPPDVYKGTSAAGVGWAGYVSLYTRNKDVFHCPSENSTPDPSLLKTGYSDYAYNKYVLGLPESLLEFPANTVQVLDCSRADLYEWDNGTDGDHHDCKGVSSDPQATPGPATWLLIEPYAQRHSGSANYLFADGHLKTLQPLSVYNNCTSPASKPSFAYK